MKKVIKFTAALFCALFILEILTNTSSSLSTKSWYIKRNGKLAPGFPCDAGELDKLGCYYIDKDANENQKKKLYLTFDVGYENGNLEKILDTLKTEKVTAAFFVLKNLIKKETDLVKRMAEDGHLVCNHTANHRDLTALDYEETERELSALEKIYKEETGLSLSKYFRFPEGKYSTECVKRISELGYKTVFWSFAYEDWDNRNQPGREYAIDKIMKNTHDGAIILLHPNSSTNAEILPELIRLWRLEGYEFYSLDHLAEHNGVK